MKSNIKFLTLLLSLLYLANCNSIEPPVNGNGQDTTSDNFSWQTWTFGEHSSSRLNDVAIISENNIWAVGEIYLNDSLGQPDPQAYNAVHWDGAEWNLKKIIVEFRGNFITPPLEGIFTFSNNDIWLVGSLPIYGDGNSWIMYDLRATLDPNISLSKAWGVSSNEIYFVGRGGSVAYYNGASLQKIESGTDLDIHDIWGNIDNRTGERTILAVASFQNYGRALDLLKIDGTVAKKLDTTGLHVNQHSIWFANNNKVYVVGNGVYYKDNIMTTGWQLDDTHPLIYKERIRGTISNDIFIVGDFGLVSHFNGAIWKHYTVNELPNLLGNYYSVVLKSNIMVAVGQMNDGQAIILRGDR